MLSKLFDLVSFIGAIQGVLVSLFLFSKRPRSSAIYFLASYVLIFSLGLLEPFAARTLTGHSGDSLLAFLVASNFLYGPLLYFFVVSIDAQGGNNNRWPIHMIPFLVVFVIEAALSYLGKGTSVHELFLLFAFETLVIQILTYNVLAILRLNMHIENGLQAAWLRWLLVFITVIYVASFTISHLKLFHVGWADQYYLIVQLMITIMIYAMTYRLIICPDLFVTAYNKLGEKSGGATRYARSGLKADQALQYLKDLEVFMSKDKPYLDPDISIHTLAQKLGISKNHLTQVLNENLRKNFYEFINAYRIEEAKRMMSHPSYSHLTLTGIGLEAGFRSKTAFNQNFKKHTGTTPTEWRKDSFVNVSHPGGKNEKSVRSARTE